MLTILLSKTKRCMVQTRLIAMSLEHLESGNVSSHLNRAPTLLLASLQLQLQSMAAAMADLTQQNQELTREVNKREQR